MKRTLLLSILFCVLSMSAQEISSTCPVISEATQSFCSSEGTGNNFYRPAVKHLDATLDGDQIVWYNSANSSEPLDPETILVDGGVYYADNSGGSCNARPFVSVIVYDAPNAGSTTHVNLCSNDPPLDLLNVYRSSILGPPDTGGTITPALQSGTTVFDPSVDPPGQYRYTVASTNENCPDDYSIVYVNIEPAPDAGEDAAVNLSTEQGIVDLFDYLGGNPDAGGIWSPSLSSGSGDFDPALDPYQVYTYTVAGNRYCEEATATVSVINQSDPTPTCPVISEATQSFCSSEGTGNNFYRPAVKHLDATLDGDQIAWYNSANSSEPLDPETILVDGGVYYADNSEGSCNKRPFVSVIVYDAPNAGSTTHVNLYSNDPPVDLLDVYRSSILGPPDTGGTITPALQSGTTVFDPSVDPPGQYRYTVASTNENCPDDYSIVYVNIEPANIPDQNIAVFPNPSSGIVNFSGDKLLKNSVLLYDLNGSLLKHYYATDGQGIENIDISSVRSGLYILEIDTPSGKIVKKIIKN